MTTFPVTVALDSRPPGVLPGMSAEVRITAETHDDALIVPIQAVTVRPDKTLPDSQPPGEGGVARGEEARRDARQGGLRGRRGQQGARARRVRTGIASDTDVEVLDGLKEGERVVEGPYRTLSQGAEGRRPAEGERPEGSEAGRTAGDQDRGPRVVRC